MEREQLALVVVAISTFAFGACSNEDVPAKGRTLERPGLCRVHDNNVASSGAPPALGTPTNNSSPLQLCASKVAAGSSAYPCSCDDYQSKYPPPPVVPTNISLPPGAAGGVDDGLTTGVYDTVVTRACHNRGNPDLCVDGQPLVGCTNDFADGEVIFAWPDCATIGQVSGTVYEPGSFSGDSIFDPGNDDDFTFHICPEAMSVRLPGDTWIPKELREPGSFYARTSSGLPGDQPVGRVHAETQGCRLYDGTYGIKDDPTSANVTMYQSRPQQGDLVTVAGDWVFDRFHELEGQGGWIEMHEARITAASRHASFPADGSVSYVFVSSAFIDGSPQKDLLEIDARVPPPAPQSGVTWVLDRCEIDPGPVAPGAPTPAFSSVVKRPAGVCSTFPLSHVKVAALPDVGACHISVDQINLNLGDVGRTFAGYNCEDECGGADFHENDIVVQNTGGASGTTTIPNTCPNIAYAGVIRATWVQQTTAPLAFTFPADGTAPGDLWMCNCSCGDPSSSTPIIAPATGCAVSGFDPSNVNDQRTACQQACGGLLCTGRQSCLTNACTAPPSTSQPVARLLGRNACVPGQNDLYRMTTAAAYHVTLKPFDPNTGLGSSAKFTVGTSQTNNIPLHGQVAFNLGSSFEPKSSGTIQIMDVADLELTPDDFSLGSSFTGVTVFAGQRLWAKFKDATTFNFEPNSVILGVRELQDGKPTGINEENTNAAQGVLDLTTGKFSLDLTVQDVDQGTQRTLIAHLEGTIDNHLPTAVITGAQSPLQCGTSLTLNAGSSSDPDPNDGITRYQWLIDALPGGTSDHVSVLSKKLGPTDYTVRVYDGSLASSSARTRINVIDTVAPQFTFVPPALTISQCSGVNIGVAQATDSCSAVTVTSDAPTTFALGQTQVTWTARDTSNNAATAKQTVTTAPPTFTFVPPALTISQCSGVNIGVAQAVDACGGAVTVTNNAPATFPIGQTVVTWTARDASGSTTTATQLVTSAPPHFTSVPPATTISQCSSPNIGTARAVDACGASIPVTSNAPATFHLGQTVVTWTARDAAGNTVTATETVTTAPPHFTSIPPAMTISQCTSPNIGTATAVDTCGGVATVTSSAPAVFHVGTTTVVWTARDGSGATATATETITTTLADDATCCPSGSHVIVGTAGNDTLTGTAGVDCIVGLGGQDTISGLGGNDIISGGDGDDNISGGDGDDVIWGGTGQDTIAGGTGNDTIDGGDGDDTCHGNDGDDVLHGGAGQDHLFGDNGSNQLFGETGDDTLTGGPGNDLLNGGGLHDVCIGGGGVNTFVTCQTQM